ncbi:MAG: universal stress protein [Gammaproteobacteria bacterium]|nr:universal stress protein [Gammaproteobacteria bacterium]
MFKKILCPLDGSAPAKQALALAIDMAKKHDIPLVLLHALLRVTDFSEFQHFAKVEGLAERVEPEVKRLQGMEARLEVGSAYDERAVSSRVLVEVGQHILDYAKFEAEHNGVREVSILLVDGDPADQILRCIDEQDIDCVVMGSRGLSGIKGFFLGSVSHKVTNRAPCTCIAVK